MTLVAERDPSVTVVLDFGSSSVKPVVIDREGNPRNPNWIPLKTEITNIGDGEVRVISAEDIGKLTNEIIQIIAQECQSSAVSHLIITGFAHSLVLIDEETNSASIAFMDDPSIDSMVDIDSIIKNNGHIPAELIDWLRVKPRSWLHKLVAVAQNYSQLPEESNLPNETPTLRASTFPAYVASQINKEAAAQIPRSEPVIDGLTQETLALLLDELGFSVNVIVAALEETEELAAGSNPELSFYGDLEAELLALRNLAELIEADESTVFFSTDSVMKVIAKNPDTEIGGLKSNSVEGMSYSTLRFGFGNLCSKVLGPIMERYAQELELAEFVDNPYRATDTLIDGLLEQGIIPDENSFFFYSLEEGGYLLLDESGEEHDLDDLAEQKMREGGPQALRQLLAQVVLGASFSMRSKVDGTYCLAHKKDANEKKPAESVTLFGGFLKYSDPDEDLSFRGLTGLFVHTLGPDTTARMTPLYTAAEAAWLASMSGEESRHHIRRYEPVKINRETGLFESQYQQWVEMIEQDSSLSNTPSGGLAEKEVELIA